MAKDSKIEWTHHTFNLVWGCTKVSEGCRNCYAEGLSNRWGFDVWGPDKPRRTFGDAHWREPLQWNREAAAAGERRRVFCSSMCDVFEDHPTVHQERKKLWPLIQATPHLDWLLLTKRPELIGLMPWMTFREAFNIWLGTTVENQEAAEKRIPILAKYSNVRVRFLSVEPLLGPVNLRTWDCLNHINWVICGGESGPGARPMNAKWARHLRDQAVGLRIPFFFKQWGQHDSAGKRCKSKLHAGRLLDGREWNEFPNHA